MKTFTITFANSETDQKLLKASTDALSSDVMVARFGHTVEYDTKTEKTTLKWWRLPTGGWDAKQSD